MSTVPIQKVMQRTARLRQLDDGSIPILMFVLLISLVEVATGNELDPDPPAVNKRLFTLLNPTPVEHLREMSTDSHGATETPNTVDAGHFQIEYILLRYSYDAGTFEGESFRRESWATGPLLLKAGLFNAVDVELSLEPFTVVRERFDTGTTTSRGFGDTTLRIKANLWGNDRGRSALAVMPYVTFPTRDKELGESRTEAGFIFPFSLALTERFVMDLTAKVGTLWNQEQHRYDTEFSQSILFGHFFYDKFFAYVEFFSSLTTARPSAWEGTFDTGLSYLLTEDVQLNAGLNIGLTRSADDWSPFIGVAWRY